MTERNGHYFEVCIALDSAEFSEIFTSEIMDFCGEAVEIEGNKIIVRTSKDKDFINALLAHLSDLSTNLKAIWQKNVSFTHSIEKKQNVDWIEEYKSGIQPIWCGRFYIYPPWCEGNLSLTRPSREFEKFSLDEPSVLSRSNFSAQPTNFAQDTRIANNLKDAESHTAHNSQSNNRSNGGVALRCFDTERAKIGLGRPLSEVSYQNNANEYPRTNCTQDDAKLINITLEPSLAFGTGHHSSTFMCIEAIESLCENGNLKNKTLLDFGCGSGILALCANKLGAKVDLCDIDELAIAESKKNFRNNNATISRIWQGTIKRESNPKYDIITANIIASVLIEQKENIALALKCGGIAILSGILDIYKDEVLARFSDFEVLNIAQKDEWICIMLRKF